MCMIPCMHNEAAQTASAITQRLNVAKQRLPEIKGLQGLPRLFRASYAATTLSCQMYTSIFCQEEPKIQETLYSDS